jgi:hypothetical protein
MVPPRRAAVALEPQPDPRAPLDVARFLTTAGPVLRRLRDDLLARTPASPGVTGALHDRSAEAVRPHRPAEAFDVRRSAWVDHVAAAWLLSVVFVRTLEDRGLVGRARIAGPGAPEGQDLLVVFREMADIDAVRELFDPEHNTVHGLVPSLEVRAALLALFRTPSTECPAFRFGEAAPRFFGDLYQDLDEGLRKRYALLQTPSFVVEYILDGTLERFIRERGLDGADVLDPTCGSGHFLLGAFDRLFKHHLARQPALDRRDAATRALRAVAGVDANPHAVAIARMQLLLAFLTRAEIKSVEQAPRLPWNLAVGDSLLLGRTRRSAHAPEDEEAERILCKRYAAVVGSPPCISVKDKELRETYRGLYPRSASGSYALSAPFLERYYDLARAGGYVGTITASSFMKREFGRRLIEELLRGVHIDSVIDTSGVYIPGHGTPTVILFGRNMPPEPGPVKVVGCRRGEPILPINPAEGRVWRAIVNHGGDVGYIDDYISVSEIPRAMLARHPWSLGAGVGAEILRALDESAATLELGQLWRRAVSAARSGADDIFLQPRDLPARAGLERDVVHPAAPGDAIRDWGVEPEVAAISVPAPPHAYDPRARWAQFLWRYRTFLEAAPSRVVDTERPAWWSWAWWPKATTARTFVYPVVAAYNEFAVASRAIVMTGGASLFHLAEPVDDDTCFALLGYLQSSTACYWMKHVLFSKTSADQMMTSFGMHPEDNRYEFSAAGLRALPVPRFVMASGPVQRHLAELASSLDRAARDLRERAPGAVLSRWDRASRASLLDALAVAQQEQVTLLRGMVRDQEDLDWLVYSALGLGEVRFEPSHGSALPEQRPVVWVSEEPPAKLDAGLRELWMRRRRAALSDRALSILEQPLYKRPFRYSTERSTSGFEADLRGATDEWLAARIEEALKSQRPPRCLDAIEIMRRIDQEDVRAVCSLRDVAVEDCVDEVLHQYAVPLASGLRYTRSGLDKHAAWLRAWEAQHRQDTGEEATARIEALPLYVAGDFRAPRVWQIRGKLDVPRERFILLPGTGKERDRFGWAGWTPKEAAAALVTLVESWAETRGDVDHVVSALAAILELIPWTQGWGTGERDPGGASAEELRSFVEALRHQLGLPEGAIRAFLAGGPTPFPARLAPHALRARR